MSTETAEWTDRTEGLLVDWHNRAAAARTAHYQLVGRCRRRNLILGIPTVIVTTVVGTSLFATLTKEEISIPLRIAVGSLSVAAAILAAITTFLRLPERAERHAIAADWYSAVRRDIAEQVALPSNQREGPKTTLDRIRKEMSKIGQQAPEIPTKLWTKTAAAFGVGEPGPIATTAGGLGPNST